MPFLSPAKVLVILVVALIVLGPDKLPKMARQIGSLWGDFRRFRERLEADVRGSFPDLPSTETITQAVRSPMAFLEQLADSPEDGTAVNGTVADEVVADGPIMDGAAEDGTGVNGTVADVTEADVTVADDAAVESAAVDTAVDGAALDGAAVDADGPPGPEAADADETPPDREPAVGARPAGSRGASPRLTVAGAGGIVHQVRSHGGVVPDDPGLN